MSAIDRLILAQDRIDHLNEQHEAQVNKEKVKRDCACNLAESFLDLLVDRGVVHYELASKSRSLLKELRK
jgi:hypothetical protein